MNSPARTKDPLFEPLRLKGLTLRNRIMSTSHSCGLNDAGMPAERYQAYHEEKARGGLALTMFGGSSNVAPDSPSVFNQLNVGVDRVIPHLQTFSDRIHAQGAALMCQITHLGRRGEAWAGDWLSTIAPSPIRETLHRSFPKEMDRHDIDRVVRAFGDAAYRCKEGGLDGIETIAASHLIGQFLSPRTIHRTDEFGGSVENRCRFGLMVHEEIRRRTGEDWIVGMRLTVDEGGADGQTFEDSVRIAKVFQAAGTVDFFNANWGRMDTLRALAEENMPAMHMASAPWLYAVGRFKQEVNLPVFHAAKIADVATARHAISEGLLDMVAMTRAHIADPHLVEKIRSGDEDRIRPCIGATHCMSGQRPKCLHNAATGRETVFSHTVKRAERTRQVLVVGGGPGGLEAARVAALRGHSVTLHEATSQLGGQVVLAARHAPRRDLIGLVDWRVSELERLGVHVHLDSYLGSEDVLAAEPDVVIVATGGLPPDAALPGHDLAISSWDVIGGAGITGSVIVYDGTGRQPAAQAALAARSRGSNVGLVSLDGEVCAELPYAERVSFKRKLFEAGIDILTDHALIAVRQVANGLVAELRNEVSLATTLRPTEALVVELGTLPTDDLYRDLAGQSANGGVTEIIPMITAQPQPPHDGRRFELHRIGDAVSSRNVASAITDAFRLCYSL